MTLRIHSDNWGELLPTNNFTRPLEKLIFPGAQLQLAGSIRDGYLYVIQQFDLKLFTIRYCCFSSVLQDVITITDSDPAITFRLGTFRSHTVLTKTFGRQVFHERGYNCFYEPESAVQYHIGPDEHYIFLDLLLKDEYSLCLYHYFPEIEEFIENALNGIAAKMTLLNQVAATEVWRWQVELHDWCFDKRKRTDANIICHKLIEQSIKSIKPASEERGMKLSQYEMNTISDIAEMIDDSEETYTLPHLASIAGISPRRLEAGFRAIYGHSILKHKFEQKMSLALRLLPTKGATVEKIAALVGYISPGEFFNDFTKRFGYPPLLQTPKATKG